MGKGPSFAQTTRYSPPPARGIGGGTGPSPYPSRHLAAGLPELGPHALRHTAATLMLEAGEPVHVVSRILGHSNIRITMDIYGHVSDEGKKKALNTLGNLLSD